VGGIVGDMGVLVVMHITGDPDRLVDAYSRHRADVWSDPAQCRSHLMARSPDGLVIADEWVSEGGFRARYDGSPLDADLRQAGGVPQVHVATILDRDSLTAPAREGGIDDAALDERIVPRDS
jgi:hypothetical protein